MKYCRRCGGRVVTGRYRVDTKREGCKPSEITRRRWRGPNDCEECPEGARPERTWYGQAECVLPDCPAGQEAVRNWRGRTVCVKTTLKKKKPPVVYQFSQK